MRRRAHPQGLLRDWPAKKVAKDLTGVVIGRLTVERRTIAGLWACRCTCGGTVCRTRAGILLAQRDGTDSRCDECAKRERRAAS